MLRSFRRDMCCRRRFTKWLISNEVFVKHLSIKFKAADYTNQWKGKTVLITGVTRGIGLIILKKLLQLEMNVIIGCRNPLVCQETLLLIQQEDSGLNISKAIIFELDFMCLKSIHNFVDQVKGLNTSVHLLINNARVFGGDFSETIDGFETQFQANCLSPFLLINLLLPCMIASSKELGSPIGRIINVTSALMCFGKIDFENLDQRHSYNPLQTYFNTQLIQILLLRQLFTNLREQDEGVRINIYAVHPGVTACELPFRKISRCFVEPFLTAKEDGANQVLYIALSTHLNNVSGEFFMHPNDQFCTNDVAYVGNQELQEKIWGFMSSFIENKNKSLHVPRRKSQSQKHKIILDNHHHNLVFFSIVDSEL